MNDQSPAAVPVPDPRARRILGSATAIIAAWLVRIVVVQELGDYSLPAVLLGKGVVVLVILIFCLFLYSSFGWLFRKVVGGISFLFATLLLCAVICGLFAWLLGRMPIAAVFGGHNPLAVAARFAALAYIAWAYCLSPVVRAHESGPRQPPTVSARGNRE